MKHLSKLFNHSPHILHMTWGIILFTVFLNDGFSQTNYDGGELSVWSLKVGYFPEYTDAFVSDGVAFTMLNENIYENEVNHGYYFSLLSTFKRRSNEDDPNTPEGSFSAGFFLNYNRKIENNILIFRMGIGVGYPVASLNLVNSFVVEYALPINKNVQLALSLEQELVHFNYFLPVRFNAGIRF